MDVHRLAFATALGLGLGSCAQTRVAYVAESQSGRMGYAEARVGPERYRVTYSAPVRTPVATVDRLALRRAAELSLAQGYGWFFLRERSVTRGIYVLPGPDGTRITYRGGFADWRRFWRFYCLGQGWKNCDSDPLWPSRARPVERVEVTYTIDLLEQQELRREVVDAARLLDQLRQEDPRR